MDDSTKLTIIKQSMKQLKPFLYEQSVAFLYPTGDDLCVASGTLVAIGQRLFVATAAHAVPDEPTQIWILSKEARSSSEPYTPILKRGKYPSDKPDVGFLELHATTALGYLKKETCPINRVVVQGPGRPFRPTVLVGNPGEYVKQTEFVKPDTGQRFLALVPTIIAYLTVPLKQGEWPPQAHDPDPKEDIFLDYPKEPAEQLETGQPIFLPNPHGMSGGGMWDQGFEDNVFWVKESAKLFGIQSCWDKVLRYVRAVQIIHWLRLVHQYYSDLSRDLEHAFPELKGS